VVRDERREQPIDGHLQAFQALGLALPVAAERDRHVAVGRHRDVGVLALLIADQVVANDGDLPHAVVRGPVGVERLVGRAGGRDDVHATGGK
jgi:hypothetical protein